MPIRPLYIVDMTFYEFLNILEIISKLDEKLSINDRKELLKKEINDMLGLIPMDYDKPPRKLSTSKDKMVQNFMVPIKQLKLLENLNDTKDLYRYFKTDIEIFYQKLRNLLLYKGNLIEYVRAIEKVNQDKNISKNSQYLDNLAYELYKRFPHITEVGHRKQIPFILRWLRDEKLGIFDIVLKRGVKIYRSKLNL